VVRRKSRHNAAPIACPRDAPARAVASGFVGETLLDHSGPTSASRLRKDKERSRAPD